MKKLIVGAVIFSFTFISLCFAETKPKYYDLDLKKGLEIFGVEERPRIIILLPEAKIATSEFVIDKKYILKKNRFEKDLDKLMKEELR